MSRLWRRILGIICLALLAASLIASPALADPTDPPVWPPTQNAGTVIAVSDSVASALPPPLCQPAETIP